MEAQPGQGSWISRLARTIRRWIGLDFDLTGLVLNDSEIMLDLAAGRE